VLFELGNSSVCVHLFAIVLDGLHGGATLDGPRCAANVVAAEC
jgi:hypothetical protein